MKPLIIVGKGQGGQEELSKAINELGYETFLTGGNKNPTSFWPRDCFVNYDGTYLTSHDDEDHPLGEGGNVRIGNGFALVSSEGISIFSGYESNRIRQQQILDGLGEEYIPNTRLYVAPNGFERTKVECEHIDLFVLLCPNNKILMVDTNYSPAASDRDYDLIAEKEGLKLIRYDGSNDVMFPLNGCVIPRSIDTVLLDSKSTRLISMLKDEGVNAVGMPMPQLGSNTAGKVNCQTNLFYEEHGTRINHLLGLRE